MNNLGMFNTSLILEAELLVPLSNMLNCSEDGIQNGNMPSKHNRAGEGSGIQFK